MIVRRIVAVALLIAFVYVFRRALIFFADSVAPSRGVGGAILIGLTVFIGFIVYYREVRVRGLPAREDSRPAESADKHDQLIDWKEHSDRSEKERL